MITRRMWLGVAGALALGACGGEGAAPAGAAVGAADAAAPAKTLPAINFSILSTESSHGLKPLWEPFLEDMSKQTGLEVKPYFATDYAGVIEAMRFGTVQVGWFSNKSGLEAIRRAPAEVFAQRTYDDGRLGYHSIILVPADSPIRTLDDLLKCDKTLSFGLGDANSTSGTLVPSAYVFTPRGINPKECFKTLTNASHEANALAVSKGQLDAATNNTSNIIRLQEVQADVLAKVREIWRSPLIGNDPLIWRKDLDVEAKRRLMHFFMSYGRQGTPQEVREARAKLAKLQFAPFLPASDALLFPVEKLELTRDLEAARQDGGLSEEQRKAKLADLEAKMAALDKLAAELPNK